MEWRLNLPVDASALVNALAQGRYADGELVLRVRRGALEIEVR